MAATIPSWANVSRETFLKLEQYAALLEKWNGKINLVSRETIPDLWHRHIWDCVQLADLIPPATTRMIDLGSGAGLPGIILAIVAPIDVTLVERDQRKCAFLLEAKRELDLKNTTICNDDAARISQTYPLVTARALASLDLLCQLAHPLMEAGAICLFPKGENFAMEVAEAEKNWSFAYQTIPSKTNNHASIISLSTLTHKG
jgi:16S rRNA (guanine527-N7)-methyltransferase